MSPIPHGWDLSPREAMNLQEELAHRVEKKNRLNRVTTIAGVDASYKGGEAHAALVVFSFPALAAVECVTATQPVEFPYVPGLLSFREGPVVLKALEKLTLRPDLLIFDAHGLAHPRRLGLACHVALWVDIPAIGCAKRRLVGTYEEPEQERCSISPLEDKGETIGTVVRTRTGVKPVFVSIGHRVDLTSSVHYVLACGKGYKLPEPTRWADKAAGGRPPPGIEANNPNKQKRAS